MKKFQLSDYKKGFILSFALHALIVFAIVYESSQPTKATPQQSKTISVALQSFTPPQQTQKALHKPTPPKVCKEKMAKHDKPKKHDKVKKHKKHKHQEHAKKHKVHKEHAPRKEEITKAKPEKSVEKVEPKEEAELAQLQEQQKPLKHKEPTKEQTQTKEAVAQVQNSQQQASAASLEEQFVQTNFEVIRALLLQNLKYPNLAKRMRQTGVVELKLVINEQGKLIDVMLKNSSGHKLLDKSALRAAELLADLDLPVPQTTSRIVLPVAFALN
ncbi:MAG: energy transducer TonB [Campylobacterales bacterium]|nr:energy transducer TonB [Campylobacterales bacterium]